MIAKLTGLLDSTSSDGLIIDVNGVGYHVSVSGRTLSQLPPVGKKFSLLIDPLVRNEQTHFFGFSQEDEREWFRLLLSIQGVGAKVALSLLSALSPDDFHHAILTQDQTLITRAEGVGPKLARRIIAELKSKIGQLNTKTLAAASSMLANTPSSSGANISDAVSALVNLGYRHHEVVEAVAQSSQTLGKDASTESLIRQGLTILSQPLTHRMSHG